MYALVQATMDLPLDGLGHLLPRVLRKVRSPGSLGSERMNQLGSTDVNE